jgi:hypothetical protein
MEEDNIYTKEEKVLSTLLDVMQKGLKDDMPVEALEVCSKAYQRIKLARGDK